MGIALALQDLFHVGHGFVIATASRQLYGDGALGIEVGRIIFRPDQRHLQRHLLGTHVLGDAKRPLGHARVLGLGGLDGIVIQGDIEPVALAGQLGGQQAIDRVLAQRRIDLRLSWGCCRRDNLRCSGRRLPRLRRPGLAASEQGKGEEQSGRSIHKGDLSDLPTVGAS
jgi:hypothetical protein